MQVASVLGVVLALSAPLSAQELEGNWEGRAVLNGQSVEIALAFSKVNGGTVGTVSLTRPNGDHELFIVHYDAPIVHLETARDKVLLVFDAESHGDTIQGWIQREGARARVELTRKSGTTGQG